MHRSTLLLDVSPRWRIVTPSHATDLWFGRARPQRRIRPHHRHLPPPPRQARGQLSAHRLEELTATQLRRFLDGQARKRDGDMKAASTIAQNVTIVNCWFDWLTREGVVRTNPTRRNGERILSRPRIGKPEENDNVAHRHRRRHAADPGGGRARPLERTAGRQRRRLHRLPPRRDRQGPAPRLRRERPHPRA